MHLDHLTRTTPRLLRGTTVVATVVAATAAATLAASPATAAPGDWVPGDHTPGWVPASSVDAEITVTQVQAGNDYGTLRSFERTGEAHTYAYDRTAWRDYQWGPAGDVASAKKSLTAPAETVPPTPSGEVVDVVDAPRPSQWTVLGDGRTYVQGSAGSYAPAVQWAGRPLTSTTLHSTSPAVDPGAAATTPDNLSVVVRMAGTGGVDLGLQEVSFPLQGNPEFNVDEPAVALGYTALAPRDQAVGNDGTLAFVGNDGTGPAVFVDEGTGAVKVAALGAVCPGQRPGFAPSATALAYVKATTPDCSTSELRVLSKTAGGSFVGGADALVTASPTGSSFETASWRAGTAQASVERLGGASRIDVGINVSKWAYPDADTAAGVILTSSANFSDSVIASALSGQSYFPLLLNPALTLDTRVKAEIDRLLEPGALIYVVGGPASISDNVLGRLDQAGYTVVRLSGKDRYSLSVEVAKEIDSVYGDITPPARNTAFMADGMNFPDALVAGPAAAQFLSPVLLTAGPTLPTVVKTYLASRPQVTTVYSIGGAAATAGTALGAKSKPIVGPDRFAVSQLVASNFFPGGSTLGVASGLVFPDALTGGALMGMLAQPLMLSRPDAVPARVAGQMTSYRSSTDSLLVFGGPATVADSVLPLLQDLAGTQTAVWGPDVPTADDAGGTTLQRAAPSKATTGLDSRPGNRSTAKAFDPQR